MTNCFEQIDKSCVTLYNKEKSLDYSVYMEEIMSKNWIDENNIDWSDRQVEEDEILSHIASLREMTVAGKIAWELISYEPPYFFIHNPFVEDLDASISQKLLVEGTAADGRTFRYRIRELINVPSGLCDIEIEEKQPSTGYETALSFDGKYEYLTSQEEVLKTYGNDSIVLFVQAVVEQLRSVNFPQMVKEPSRVFSAEPLPAEVTDLPIVQKAQELFAARNAIAFHELTLSDVLREGLGVKD